MSAEDWMKLSDIDPEFEQVLASEKPPPFDLANTPVQTIRQFTPPHSAAPEDVNEIPIEIPIRDGSRVPARLHTPNAPVESGSPLYVMFHGGGFCVGGPSMEEFSARLFVQHFDFIVLNVDYRLAPEHPFPAAPNDAWDAVRWAAAHAADLGADPSKGFVVGGTSAGGNLANVVAHLARDAGLKPKLTGVHAMVPSACPESVLPEKYRGKFRSMEQNANAPGGINITAVRKFREGYKPDEHSPLFAYFNHPKGHTGLPPHFLQICGLDPFRDEALIYEEVLREECGVVTKLNVYKGLPHGFWVRYPEMKASEKFRQEMVEGVGWLQKQHQG